MAFSARPLFEDAVGWKNKWLQDKQFKRVGDKKMSEGISSPKQIRLAKQRIEDIKRRILAQKRSEIKNFDHAKESIVIELKPKVISKLSINKQMIIRSLKDAYNGS